LQFVWSLILVFKKEEEFRISEGRSDRPFTLRLAL
jgi:hypothetical protein